MSILGIGKMVEWEPTCNGPTGYNADVNEWLPFEQGPSTRPQAKGKTRTPKGKVRAPKGRVPNPLNKMPKGGKVGIFVGLLALGATLLTPALKNECFETLA